MVQILLEPGWTISPPPIAGNDPLPQLASDILLFGVHLFQELELFSKGGELRQRSEYIGQCPWKGVDVGDNVDIGCALHDIEVMYAYCRVCKSAELI
jgi:hypothetical protein